VPGSGETDRFDVHLSISKSGLTRATLVCFGFPVLVLILAAAMVDYGISAGTVAGALCAAYGGFGLLWVAGGRDRVERWVTPPEQHFSTVRIEQVRRQEVHD
jgi:hypothetical protein